MYPIAGHLIRQCTMERRATGARSRVLAARAAVTMAAVAVAACGDAMAPLTPADVVGTYALRTIDDRPLPRMATGVPPDTVAFESYVIRLAADGTGDIEATHRIVPSGRVSQVRASLEWRLDAGARAVVLTTSGARSGPSTSRLAVLDRGGQLFADRGPDVPDQRYWRYARVP
jgi:hypothetical protein